jgi:hypothetical protein
MESMLGHHMQDCGIVRKLGKHFVCFLGTVDDAYVITFHTFGLFFTLTLGDGIEELYCQIDM